METTIRIIDPKSEYLNQEFKGACIYYDIHHTGGNNVVDLFRAEIKPGEKKTFYSTQIDVPHYENQLLQERINELGANVGDTVIILELGSGSYKAKFDMSKPYLITNITSSGHVQFNNGEADIFRPKIQKIN